MGLIIHDSLKSRFERVQVRGCAFQVALFLRCQTQRGSRFVNSFFWPCFPSTIRESCCNEIEAQALKLPHNREFYSATCRNNIEMLHTLS